MTTRGKGSTRVAAPVSCALKYARVLGGEPVDRGREGGPHRRPDRPAGPTATKQGRRLVKRVWSGVAGPTAHRAAASRDCASSSTSGASSKTTTCRRSRPTRPRRTGAASRATRRRTSGGGAGTRHPAEAHPTPRCVGDGLLGPADQLHRAEIRLLHRGSPGDRPVLFEQEGAQPGGLAARRRPPRARCGTQGGGTGGRGPPRRTRREAPPTRGRCSSATRRRRRGCGSRPGRGGSHGAGSRWTAADSRAPGGRG